MVHFTGQLSRDRIGDSESLENFNIEHNRDFQKKKRENDSNNRIYIKTEFSLRLFLVVSGCSWSHSSKCLSTHH